MITAVHDSLRKCLLITFLPICSKWECLGHYEFLRVNRDNSMNLQGLCNAISEMSCLINCEVVFAMVSC